MATHEEQSTVRESQAAERAKKRIKLREALAEAKAQLERGKTGVAAAALRRKVATLQAQLDLLQ